MTTEESVKTYTQTIERVSELAREIDNGSIMEGIRRRKKEIAKEIVSRPENEAKEEASINMLTCRYSNKCIGQAPDWNKGRSSLEIPINKEFKLKPNFNFFVDYLRQKCSNYLEKNCW